MKDSNLNIIHIVSIFGSTFELENLPDIKAACLSFGVRVTGEEV